MMSYLHELAADLVEHMTEWAAVAEAIAKRQISAERNGRTLAQVIRKHAEELARVVELAKPELVLPEARKGPTVFPPALQTAYPAVSFQAQADPGPPAEIGTVNIDQVPTPALPVRQLAKDLTGVHLFLVTPATFTVHLCEVKEGKAHLELDACNSRGEPLFAWWCAIGPGESFNVELARIDVAVRFGEEHQVSNTGG